MHITGYIASLFIGISLGLIGGGGLFLLYLYWFIVRLISYPGNFLFIIVVGSESLIGSFNSWCNGLVDFQTVFLFGISSVIIVFITRKTILPNIPEKIIVGNITLHFSILTMVLFAVLMLFALTSMIKNTKVEKTNKTGNANIAKLILHGISIGLVTGILCAGGGFLLVPALVMLLHLPIKKAISTSLFIIALNSLAGFIGDVGHLYHHTKSMVAIIL